MIRIYIILDEKSMAGLVVLAKQEYRDPRQQASIIVRQELLRRGFLSDNLRAERQTQAQNIEPAQVQNADQPTK